MSNEMQNLEQLCVDTIRVLSIDGVEKAKSGHPGTPMGLADIAYVLWTEFLHHDPKAPKWHNRDRFILSAGHASMLLYSLLYLSGYEDMTMEQLQSFRQWGSKTAGHPEYGHATGIEVTTGPLGQGFANGVGMALASKMMAARFNTAEFAPVANYVYALCSDGDLMEGISAEAASIAGHLGLGNIIYFYDDNKISIEGETRLSFSEDVEKRFKACGWHVQKIDGHDRDQVRKAIRKAQKHDAQPSIIIAKTVIGYGSPNMNGSHEVHGAPLGPQETIATKKVFGWPAEEAFFVPEGVREEFARKVGKLARARRKWEKAMKAWRAANPGLAADYARYWSHEVPADFAAQVVAATRNEKGAATRVISGQAIQKIAELVPFFVGGSADLAPSTNTLIKTGGSIERSKEHHGQDAPAFDVFKSRNLHFGIREHAMGAIVNGMTLYGSWRAFGATFMQFVDYMRAPVRLASLMRIPSIFVYTHDSIFLGEDGPTHQPVEHLWTIRGIPDITVFRPGTDYEVGMAWAWAVAKAEGPTVLVFTRQKLEPVRAGGGFDMETVWKGAYVVSGYESGDVTLLATGSELPLAVQAAEELKTKGISARVVSAPSLELFDRQTKEYQDAILGDRDKLVAIEAGRTDGWWKYVSHKGLVIGVDTFGASAPAERLAEEFRLTPGRVAKKVAAWWRG
ncbi:MAG: transketolase [Thermoanaerobaculia bacterium]|nr:transketolase [Thermoanaerobaculia bacterium]